MKWSRGMGILGLLWAGASAQLQPGDIAFTGFNADGNDDLAFVTFKAIPAGTVVYFCDSEWNGTGLGTDEGAWGWNSGASTIPAGTVVSFSNVSSAIAPSVGTIVENDAGGLGNSDEAVFAFLGTGPRAPTTMLAAIGTRQSSFYTPAAGSLAGTGLTFGSTAIVLPTDIDIAAYTGPRTGLDPAGYLAALNSASNWITQDASGDQHNDGTPPDVPFNLTPFTLGGGPAPVVPAISFDKAFYSVKENSGALLVRLNTTAAPSDTARVGIRLVPAGTAQAGTDFTFANQIFVWPRDSAGFRTLSIPLINNATAQPDRFFVLELHGPTGATLGSSKLLSVYILDDDTQVPAGSNELDLRFVSSFKVDSIAGASAEIVAHDPKSQRLFAMNSTRDRLEILNFKNPRAISKIATIDLLAYGSGGTSVAFKNGLVAVTIDAADFAPGKVVFLDTNGTILKSVNVGSLPDMVTFTPDGKYVLAANEGQPSNDYLTDPEGSVSIIDMTGGIDSVNQGRVTTATFQSFNGQKAALQAAGVRIFGLNNPTVAQDLEPEYITVSEDSKTAWVTLQENNAIARLDLVTKAFTNIFPLGLKDHSLPRNALDVSDQLDSIFFGTWPIKGVYMPDAIASLTVGDTTFLFTANEGDAREYSAYVEEKKVGDAAYKLDSTVFPHAAVLKLNTNLGRLAVTSASGDLDGDGFYEEIHAFGARSFSVWNGATGAQVWDSGDELERITAADPVFGKIFNASNDNIGRKNRSDNKGPEPEGITIGAIGGKRYAFIALERIGGVMAYEVTNPRAPRFVAWANNRNTTALGGDLGSEGIIFIPKAQSPNDTALIVLANEVSATVSVYSVRDTNAVVIGVRAAGGASALQALTLHRVPGQDRVYFSRPVDFKLADARGKVHRSGKNAAWADLAGLQRGRYFLTIPGAETFTLPVVE